MEPLSHLDELSSIYTLSYHPLSEKNDILFKGEELKGEENFNISEFNDSDKYFFWPISDLVLSIIDNTWNSLLLSLSNQFYNFRRYELERTRPWWKAFIKIQQLLDITLSHDSDYQAVVFGWKIDTQTGNKKLQKKYKNWINDIKRILSISGVKDIEIAPPMDITSHTQWYQHTAIQDGKIIVKYYR